MNAIILKGAALRSHKVAPEPKQLPTVQTPCHTVCSMKPYKKRDSAEYEGEFHDVCGNFPHEQQ
jgi:hypothetical protein